ncbi:chromosomal replication initiator protein DnaA [Blastochloris tepida]|uniref:Chromosomal replication initiator protein DnaA n=2 Tax=Blastochloris tepida TaxID=2233851 RepID=A0A348FXR1_9HYPH|nr:chromosomal replication initiator protein DnaA [Blastochloris tepida]
MLKSEGLETGFFPGHKSVRSAQPAFARTSTRFDTQFDSQMAAASWDRVRSRLKSTLGEEVYASWFACMQLDAVAGEGVRLSVPTRFLKSWIQTHYAEPLDAFWREEMPSLKQVDLVVRSAVARLPARPAAVEPAPAAAPALPAGTRPRPMPIVDTPFANVEGLPASPLDPRLTFETFMVGRSNTLAHAAAQEIAESRAGESIRFNPLYVHAAVGLGKTHLLQAIAWRASRLGRRVLYLTAEKFMFGFVAALKNQTALAFKEALRGIDLLIIDDLQFLQGKSVQQEFCHTLNALIDSGRPVVIAADRPPGELESLDERVRSRLAGGLSVEIGPLEEELRRAILAARIGQIRTKHPGFEVPAEVVDYVAAQVTANGRDLDGALNRLLAHNTLTSCPVTLEMAEHAIRDLVRHTDTKRVRIEDIIRLVAEHSGISKQDILSSRRTANVVLPRQVAMYLAKTLTLRSLPEIGRRFGGRDHTTVLHAVRKIEEKVKTDRAFADEVELLKRRILD